MLLYLMRHGETDWNKAHLWQGRTDIPLNDNGRKVAELTREGLKDIHFDYAFCSPLCRAKETAEIILADRDVELVVDERVIEMGFGEWEGTDMRIKKDEIAIYFKHPESYVDEHGVEPFEEMLKRAHSFFDELIANPKYEDSTILVATHGAALRGLICVLKGNPVEQFWEGGVHKNCGMTVAEIKDGKAKILRESFIVYDEAQLEEKPADIQMGTEK